MVKLVLVAMVLLLVPAILLAQETIPGFEELPAIGKFLAGLFGVTAEDYLKLLAIFTAVFPITNLIKDICFKAKNTVKWDLIVPLLPAIVGGVYGYFFIGATLLKSVGLGIIAGFVYYIIKAGKDALGIGSLKSK